MDYEKLKELAFKPIGDSAEETDKNPHGTHKTIAKALFEQISQCKKAISIALEGSWGTGKSTIVKLLKGMFQDKKNDKTLFFTFDTWATEIGDLRKQFIVSFIEEIKSDLKRTHPNDSKTELVNLEYFRKRILGHIKVTRVVKENEISNFAKILAVLIITATTGPAFISATSSNLVWFTSGNASGDVHWFAVIGFLVAFLPLIYIFCAFLIKKLGVNVKISFHENVPVDEQEIEVSGEYEFSSIEFEDLFNRLLRRYLLGEYTQEPSLSTKSNNLELWLSLPTKTYDRAVVVVDNIDRLESNHAQKTWSTLQTFLKFRSNGGDFNAIENKVWFIFPFDREALSQQASIKETISWPSFAGNDPVLRSFGLSSSSQNQTYTEFFEKCYQQTVWVPKPVSSGWASLLEDTIDAAFSFKQNNDINAEILKEFKNNIVSTVTQVYGKSLIFPSPRKIISTVNQIGFLINKLKMINETNVQESGKIANETQHEGRVRYIDLEAVTYFSLKKSSMSDEEFRKSLMDRMEFNYEPMFSAQREFIKELAGLLFGVDKKTAVELMLSEPIMDCFSHNTGISIEARSEKLRKMLDNYPKAFWNVWHNVSGELENLTKSIDPIQVSLKIQVFLAFYRLLSADEKSELERLKEKMLDAFSELSFSDDILNADFAKAYARFWPLANIEQKNSLLESIVNTLKGQKENVFVKNVKPAQVKHYFNLFSFSGVTIAPYVELKLSFDTIEYAPDVFKPELSDCFDGSSFKFTFDEKTHDSLFNINDSYSTDRLPQKILEVVDTANEFRINAFLFYMLNGGVIKYPVEVYNALLNVEPLLDFDSIEVLRFKVIMLLLSVDDYNEKIRSFFGNENSLKPKVESDLVAPYVLISNWLLEDKFDSKAIEGSDYKALVSQVGLILSVINKVNLLWKFYIVEENVSFFNDVLKTLSPYNFVTGLVDMLDENQVSHEELAGKISHIVSKIRSESWMDEKVKEDPMLEEYWLVCLDKIRTQCTTQTRATA